MVSGDRLAVPLFPAIAEAGGVVVPAAPGFYHGPRTVQDLVAHVVQKVTDVLGLGLDLVERWEGR